jgi:hypothetical protein
VSKEKELWVQTFEKPIELNPPIKMEVGVENALHIEFEFNQSRRASLFLSLPTPSVCSNSFKGRI